MEESFDQIKIKNFIFRLLKFFVRHHKLEQSFMLHNDKENVDNWHFIFEDCALFIYCPKWCTEVKVIFYPDCQYKKTQMEFRNDATFPIFYKECSWVSNFTEERKHEEYLLL